MSITEQSRAIIYRYGAKKIASLFRLELITIDRWLTGDTTPPPYLSAALQNVANARKAFDPRLISTKEVQDLLGVSERTVQRWQISNQMPMIARHAITELRCRRKIVTPQMLDNMWLISRATYCPYNERTWRDVSTGHILKAVSFEKLEQANLAKFSPKLKKLILTAKGRAHLNAKNVTEAK